MPIPHRIRVAYNEVAVAPGARQVLDDIVVYLASGGRDRKALAKIVRQAGIENSQLITRDLLELVVAYVEISVRSDFLSDEDLEDVRELKRILGIKEGDFYRFKRDRVGAVLQRQLAWMLDDRKVDSSEALEQVRLQTAFDLGYDQYLELTRGEADRLVDGMIERITADGVVTTIEKLALQNQIGALDRVYKLSPAQRAKLVGRM